VAGERGDGTKTTKGAAGTTGEKKESVYKKRACQRRESLVGAGEVMGAGMTVGAGEVGGAVVTVEAGEVVGAGAAVGAGEVVGAGVAVSRRSGGCRRAGRSGRCRGGARGAQHSAAAFTPALSIAESRTPPLKTEC